MIKIVFKQQEGIPFNEHEIDVKHMTTKAAAVLFAQLLAKDKTAKAVF